VEVNCTNRSWTFDDVRLSWRDDDGSVDGSRRDLVLFESLKFC